MLRETTTLKGTKAQRRKRYKNIVQELGQRNISLGDIHADTKQLGLMEMIKDNTLTLDELTVLQQYARAIFQQDTRAAEFLRDTAGDKPSLDITTAQANPLHQFTDEELDALIAAHNATEDNANATV